MKKVLCSVMILACILGIMAGCTSNQPVVSTVNENGEDVLVNTAVSTISVMGEGRLDVEPDMATVELGVYVIQKSASEATKAASDTVENIKEKLLSLGIQAEDVRTTNFYIYPQYKSKSTNIERYHASNMLEVKIYDLKKVGAVLDGAIEAGANRSYGISFDMREPLTHQNAALQLAVENAKSKAQVLAKTAGRELGNVLAITDGFAQMPDVYFQSPRDDLASAAGEGLEQYDISISPGMMRVTASVTVRFIMD